MQMETAMRPSAGLAALSEPIRWRMVELLRGEQLCVCHLVEELEIPQPLVSHHLKVLREAGLVVGERYRYWTYYRLVPGAVTLLADQVRDVAGSQPARDRRPCC
jgi:ArsR family transcriptional regulator, arsenate/arsenite/antimonite-responsive transcriptional repressor